VFSVNLKKMRRNIFQELINDNPPFRAFTWWGRHRDVGVINTTSRLSAIIKSSKKQGGEITVFSRLLKIPQGRLYKVVYYNVKTSHPMNSPVGLALGTACDYHSLIAFYRVSSKEFQKLSDHGVSVIDWSNEFDVRKEKVRVESNTSAQR